jgi:hypothetical protein
MAELAGMACMEALFGAVHPRLGADTMVRRFLTAVLILLSYMAGGAVILALSLAIYPPLIFIGMIVIVIGLVPAMNSTARRAFFYQGMGEPVSLEELRRRLLEVNGWDAPVTVQQTKPNTFAVTWRYLDARWWELIAKAGISKLYTLQIKVNDARHEVVLVDKLRSVEWGIGPSEVHVGVSGFVGVLLEWEIGVQYGIRENFTLGEVYDYTFSNDEIKTPVMNTILQSGWNVRMAMW